MCACIERLNQLTAHLLFATRKPLAVNPLKIFLVEDSAVIRASLIATLEELAPVQIVDTAEDEQHAVEWMRDPAHEFDLAIVDIQLRSGTGIGVIQAASSLSPLHRLVVLTNYATPSMRIKCLSLGADKVFDKSNEIDALLAYCNTLASSESSGKLQALP